MKLLIKKNTRILFFFLRKRQISLKGFYILMRYLCIAQLFTNRARGSKLVSVLVIHDVLVSYLVAAPRS